MLRISALLCAAFLLTAASPPSPSPQASPDLDAREWLAGDHHVHSEFSAGWQTDPGHPRSLPKPVLGGDSSHTIRRNAEMARRFDLDWMVSTDHGGPGHSALQYRLGWPALEDVRKDFPELMLFYGLEFDTPGGEHASLVMPMGPDEREDLRRIEAGFAERDAWPTDAARDTKPKMLEALRFMAGLNRPPVLLANHPSRTATGKGIWGLHDPQEFRAWMDAAPKVAVGMEGAPGHQAAHPAPGADKAHGSRGLYGGYPTMGGFDQMTATLGGAWDAMLAEGRHWWITIGSDSHGHYSEGGADFWPGEYARTWVHARRNAADLLDGLRNGRMFVTTGNLVTGLSLALSHRDGTREAVELGDTVSLAPGERATMTLRLRLPGRAGGAARRGSLDHVDVILGSVRAGAPDSHVAKRFVLSEKQVNRGEVVVDFPLPPASTPYYIRLRGTNTGEGEPALDTESEDPDADRWFYSNPVWITQGSSPVAGPAIVPR
nr:phosphoesterase [uncultured Novosphingobium sp.]